MKKNLTLVAVTLTTFLAISYTAFAQVSAVSAQQGLTTFAGLITTFNNTVVKALATLFLSGAVVAFFFGVAKFIWGLREGKADAITNGRQFMIWSLIGLFTMFSVYGIIRVAQSLIPGLNSSTITVPDFNIGGSGATPNANTGVNPFTPTPNANTGNNPLTPVPSANTGASGATPNANTGNNRSAYVGGTPSPNANTGDNPSAFVGGSQETSSPRSNGESCNLPEDCVSNYCKTSRTGGFCATKGTSGYGAECSDTANSSDCSSGLVCHPTSYICVSP